MNDSRIPETWRNELRKRVLLPSIGRSIASNIRWMKIFAAQRNMELDSLQLPMLPMDPSVLEDGVGDRLPSPLFALFQDFIMTDLSPSHQLRDFNKTLRDWGVEESADSDHWLRLYGHCSDAQKHPPNLYERKEHKLSNSTSISRLFFYQRLVYHLIDWKDDANNTIQRQQVEDFLFAQAKSFLLEYPYSTTFNDLMKSFRYYWGRKTKSVSISLV